MSPGKFEICEIEPCFGVFTLSSRFRELDLVRNGINNEKQITLLNDLAVLETDLCERAANLSAQLHTFYCRELAQELEPYVDIRLERLADGDFG